MLTMKLAYRNVLRQKRRSLLTGLSMSGGYVLFVISISLLEGSWGNAVDIFTLDHTGHIQIHQGNYLQRPKIHKTIKDRESIEQVLVDEERVTGYAPRIYSPALAYGGDKADSDKESSHQAGSGKTSPAFLIGVDPDTEPAVSRLFRKVTSGEYFDSNPDENGYFQAMIGAGLATTLKCGVGDEIILISQGGDGSIANDIFIIRAIIGNTTSFDRLAVYLPITAAQIFLSLGNDVHEYAMLVRNKHRNEQVASDLQAALPDATVSPWQKVEESFYRTMQSDRQGNHFTMGVIVFLVFVGVLNTVLMSVLERTREFGVLRSIGCRPTELVKLIFIETLLLTGMSIAVGLLIALPAVTWFTQEGILLPQAIDMAGIKFQHMKGEFSPYVFFMPMLFILVAAAVTSLPPGIRAARILPKDALGSH